MKRAENDITDEKLQSMMNSVTSQSILIKLVETSRQYFGWYTKHLPRVYEYPWIVAQLPIVKNKTILDIGAGVSPLPIFLANGGARIFTVDNSNYIRSLKDGSLGWNEWGFFDYSVLNPNVNSINKEILEVQFKDKFFDCVYSVSVIEHMKSSTRKQLWKKIRNWIKEDGSLLLTVDLIPETENLWNYCEGLVVEPVEHHGSLNDLKSEISAEGFSLKKCEFQRTIPDSRVDISFLSFIKNPSS